MLLGRTQHIIVTDSGTHEEVVHAVVRASIGCLVAASKSGSDADQEAWQTWMVASQAKVVKRTSLPKVQQIAAEVPGAVLVDAGTVTAVGTPPILDHQRHDLVRKARTADFQRPHGDVLPLPDSGWVVLLNSDVSMTTGKVAAQAAHSVVGALVAGKIAKTQLNVFAENVQIRHASEEQMLDLSRDHYLAFAVHDAGRTEIPRGTLTAALMRMS